MDSKNDARLFSFRHGSILKNANVNIPVLAEGEVNTPCDAPCRPRCSEHETSTRDVAAGCSRSLCARRGMRMSFRSSGWCPFVSWLSRCRAPSSPASSGGHPLRSSASAPLPCLLQALYPEWVHATGKRAGNGPSAPVLREKRTGTDLWFGRLCPSLASGVEFTRDHIASRYGNTVKLYQ